MQADRHVIRKTPVRMTYRKWEQAFCERDGQPGFETPTGKFEIRSTILERYGYDGLSRYTESDETPLGNPELCKRYPLVLGTGPFKPDMKSCLRAIPGFQEKYPSPVIEINTGDADSRGISTGDLVIVKTARDSVPMRASVHGYDNGGCCLRGGGRRRPLGDGGWRRAEMSIV